MSELSHAATNGEYPCSDEQGLQLLYHEQGGIVVGKPSYAILGCFSLGILLEF